MNNATDRPNRILSRNEIPNKFRWDIESLYGNLRDWEEDYQQADKLRGEIIKYKEKFALNSNSFLECLQLKDEIFKLIEKIYTYAHMRKDEDNQNDTYQSIFYRASGLLVRIEESLSFIEPGILSLDMAKIERWIKDNDKLKIYYHYLKNVFRKREHILSPEEEKIVAQIGEITMVPENSFNMLNHADLRFSALIDREGKKIPISHGNFIPLLKNKDKNFRKKVFKKYYEPYHYHRNTYASLLVGNLQKDRFYSKIRRYKNSMEAALFEDNIPISVYENLLDIVHKNIHLLHYYIQLKRDFLNIDSFNMYDMYVPLSEKITHIDYPKAQDIIIHGLAPLGDSYLSIIKEGFRERWIDIYENKGKTSGAYSTGSYQSKPFILLNYQGTLEDVYTLGHELGHSLHSYYTHKEQPFIYSGYSIFLAEIASTTNEALLTHYLLAKAERKEDKLIILNHFLEQFRSTLFRQAMFAEFEKIIHEHDEKRGSLTADWLSSRYADLNRHYFGKNVIIDKDIKLEWARIPHFYYNYYVYQYATGFAAAITFSRKILNEGESAVQKYMGFLKKGNSDYPVEILKEAGVDMTTDQQLIDAMKLFEELLMQLEKLKN